MRAGDTKPYTKEEICKFLDFLFLSFFSQGNLRCALYVQGMYEAFEIIPIAERMIGSLAKLDKEEKNKW